MSILVLSAHKRARRPGANLYRAFGLAAVAAELGLRPDMLEPDAAAAVQKGDAALVLAGFGPSLIRRRSSARLAGQQAVPAARIPIENGNVGIGGTMEFR